MSDRWAILERMFHAIKSPKSVPLILLCSCRDAAEYSYLFNLMFHLNKWDGLILLPDTSSLDDSTIRGGLWAKASRCEMAVRRLSVDPQCRGLQDR